MKFVFFGSSEFSVFVLEELELHGLLPSLIVTTPNKPQGRRLQLTPNIVKTWAQNHHIETYEPASLRNNSELLEKLNSQTADLFLVASYGKIIPRLIFELPTHQTLNIHPSLLPKYRGASPIQSQILADEKSVGVSIMLIEETMDTGPILSQKAVPVDILQGRQALEKKLAIEGARLFAHIAPEWIMGVISPIPQNEELASYCQKLSKADGELDLREPAKTNLLKIKAFEGWPTAYFFDEEGRRIIIKAATLQDGELEILEVLPEGRKAMPYPDFLRGQNKPN